MFGQPQWFRRKTRGFGLVPIAWQGWLYTAGWIGATAVPFLLLIARHQPLEAAAWLGLMASGLTYDVWQIRRASRCPAGGPAHDNSALSVARHNDVAQHNDKVLYIMDSQPGATVATRNYQLHARR